MELLLYTFSKRKNSTARPSASGTSVNVNLKTGTSFLRPTFLLEGDIESFSLFNYAKWNDTYYFISNMQIERNNLISLELSYDSLATFKSEIGNYTCFVERAESLNNPMIEDDSLSQTYNLTNIYQSESASFPNVVNNGVYLLRTSGESNVGSSIGITTYAIYSTQLAQVLDFLFEDENYDFLTDTSVKSFFNPFQYIIDCQWSPFGASVFGSTVSTVKLGWWDTGVNAYVVDKPYITEDIPVSIPHPTFNDFRGYSSKYTKLYIYIPASGWYQLNPLDVTDRIWVKYYIDIATGQAQVHLENDLNAIIGVFPAQLSCHVAIGQLTVDLLQASSSIASGIGDLFSGNIGTGITNLINGTHTVLQPTQSVNGNSGNIASIMVNNTVQLYRYEYGSASFPNTIGRPLMQNVRLGTLSGYIKCGNASIPTEALDSIKSEINNYLNGGFYYE